MNTETSKIRIGVVGAGKMGQNHIRALSELGNMFDLVGIYDPDPKKAVVAEQYGTRFYSDYEKMLDDVQAVTLPCPTSTHKKMAIAAAKKGVHALLEKPIAETIDDAMEICDAFNSRSLKFTVGYIERFNPVVKAMADIIQGLDVVAVEVHRCSPFDSRIYDVDVVSDLMIHDLDIVMNSLGMGAPKSISAIGRNIYSDSFADYAQATLCFPDGVLAFVTTSRTTEDKIRSVCVHAKGAYIEGDLLNRTLTIKRSTNYYEDSGVSNIKYKQSNITEQVVLPNVEPLKEEIRAFGKSILENKESEITWDQVLLTMEVLAMVGADIYSKIGEEA